MKIALRVLLGLLLVFVLLALLVLLPAHLQIRDIEPSLPQMDAIVAALENDNGPIAVSYVNSASQSGPGGNLGHPGVIISWPSGKRFLIDTGMRPAEAIAFGEAIELMLDADPAEPHGSIADQLGDGVNAIQGIAFTHLHTDHTDGLGEICSKQEQPATVFQTALQYYEQNHTTSPGLDHLEAAQCSRVELPDKNIMAVPGFPGLVAIALGGHTPGSTLYVARVGERYWFFSGDITNDKSSLLQDIPKHWSYSSLIVPENTRRTERLRAWLREFDARGDAVVLPAHDVAEMAVHLPAQGEPTL